MAKVLWLQNLWIEFYGVMVISAIAKKSGHHSDLVMADTPDEALCAVEQYKPDVVAFSCMSVQWKWAKQVATHLKEHGVNAPIIVGGIHATMYPGDAIQHPAVDAVCLNEGEFPMLEFMNALDTGADCSRIQNLWVRANGKIIRNPTRSKLTAEQLEALPLADRELYKKYEHFRKYPFEIFVGSRGCPFKCSFCEVPEINQMYGGKSVYYRDPISFVDEIEEVKRRGLLDGKLVMFTDSTFNSNKKWFLAFLEEYRKRIQAPFSCNLRVDLVDEIQIRALAESGCDNVRFGVEAGDADIRNRILDKHLTDDQIFKAADLLKKYRIPFVTFNLFGSPEETYEQAWKTIRINQRIKPSAVGAYVFVLFPGIRATNYAIEKGLIDQADLDLLDKHPYNVHLSLLARHPKRNPDIVRICNLQKFAILLVRIPLLEPLVRLAVKLPPLNVFGTLYAICQTWEWRRWSTKTTFRRLLYEAILNYQALIETDGDEKSLLRRLSLAVSGYVKRRRVTSAFTQPGIIDAFPERRLSEKPPAS